MAAGRKLSPIGAAGCARCGGEAATVASVLSGSAVATRLLRISALVSVCIGSQGGMRSAMSSTSMEAPISMVYCASLPMSRCTSTRSSAE